MFFWNRQPSQNQPLDNILAKNAIIALFPDEDYKSNAQMVTLTLCKLSLLSRSKGEQDKGNIGRTRVTSRQSFWKNTLQNIG